MTTHNLQLRTLGSLATLLALGGALLALAGAGGCSSAEPETATDSAPILGRECVTHEDCGCPKGATTFMVQHGACAYGCPGTDSRIAHPGEGLPPGMKDVGFCRLLCDSDAQCPPEKSQCGDLRSWAGSGLQACI